MVNCLHNSGDVTCNVSLCDDICVAPDEVKQAIKNLDCNKSCGLDGIAAEHLQNSSDSVLPLFSMCLTALLIHGFLPERMLSVVLVPVIKDKNGKINSKDNYRPIALASIISKAFEHANE